MAASEEIRPPDRQRLLSAHVPPELARKILAAGSTGERRTVTALFCDVVGSTGVGERLGPERTKVVMDQVLGRMIVAVSRYEGTVTQLRGDGLLAFFGAPLMHEDDAERAVRAALDLREALAAYSRELEAAYGLSLQIRIGLNTGPVVISRVTDVLEVAYNALGDTVNTAARLEGAATPGTIVASEATARPIASLFNFRVLGPLALKGKESPVPAVEVIGARAVAGKPRGISGLTSWLVGRDPELALLRNAVEATLEGRGQIVTIIGEAGIGKSRLIAESQTAGSQVTWLEGRCLSYAENIPYLPFIDLLREWLGVTSADPEAKIRIELRAALNQLVGTRADEVYPYLAAMLRLHLEPEAAAQIANLDAESLQRQTFKAMREWTLRLAGQLPLALILDDLHWADATSLALVETLLGVTEEAPVLVALLLRPEREHGCWRLNDLARQQFPHRHVEVMVRALTVPDTEQLVDNLLAISEFPGDLRELILQKAEGNPFFVEEVLRGLVDSQILVRDGDHWQATRRVTALDIPDSIQAVLLARIDRLSDDARRILQAASVIGRLFSLETLRDVVAGDAEVNSILGDLQRLEMVIERRRIPQAEYRFRHVLVQEVAYSTLVDSERRRLHREVARALEVQYAGRLEEVFGLLTYHCDQSGDGEAVLRFAPRAAKQASSLGAHREAAVHYSTALRYSDRIPSEERASLLEAQSYECYLIGQVQAAVEACGEALDIWRQLGRRESEGASLRWLSRLTWFLGDRVEAERHAAMALQVLEELPPGRELAMAYSNLAQLHMLAEKYDEAVLWGTRAIDLARELGDYEILVHALNNVGTAEFNKSGVEGRTKLDQSLQLALEHGLEEHVARAYNNLAVISIWHRDHPRAVNYLHEGIAYCTERDLVGQAQNMRARRTELRLQQGNWSLAAQDAETLLKTEIHTYARIIALLVLALVRVRRGESQGQELLDEARDLAQGTGENQRIGPVAAARAEAAWLKSDLETCVAEARPGFELALIRPNQWLKGELSFWMWRGGVLKEPPPGIALPFALQMAGDWRAAAAEWERIGCPYERALALADGDEAAQRAALDILGQLGALPAAEITRRKQGV